MAHRRIAVQINATRGLEQPMHLDYSRPHERHVSPSRTLPPGGGIIKHEIVAFETPLQILVCLRITPVTFSLFPDVIAIFNSGIVPYPDVFKRCYLRF